MHYTEVSIARVFATGRVFARKYSILVKLTMYKYTTPKAVLYIYARCKMVSAGGAEDRRNGVGQEVHMWSFAYYLTQICLRKSYVVSSVFGLSVCHPCRRLSVICRDNVWEEIAERGQNTSG